MASSPESSVEQIAPFSLVTTRYADTGIAMLASDHQFHIDWKQLSKRLASAVSVKEGMLVVNPGAKGIGLMRKKRYNHDLESPLYKYSAVPNSRNGTRNDVRLLFTIDSSAAEIVILHAYKKRDNASDCPEQEILAACRASDERSDIVTAHSFTQEISEQKDATGTKKVDAEVKRLRAEIFKLTKENHELVHRHEEDVKMIAALKAEIDEALAVLCRSPEEETPSSCIRVNDQEEARSDGNAVREPEKMNKTLGSARAFYEQPISAFDRFMSKIEAILPYPLFLKRRKKWKKLRKLRHR
ncbi:hypothetical protein COW46_02200 [Candidatus Gracilibacteria bacterium CG17_big_fil_post_rev_8_21_14_2_50_48_13]|nr:MAG: hypothetical protein COW46_02200 [Candidatus Gracilibacteria bacterium CG17_big_fil_post_rev_8_21_14_2_50_48_13]